MGVTTWRFSVSINFASLYESRNMSMSKNISHILRSTLIMNVCMNWSSEVIFSESYSLSRQSYALSHFYAKFFDPPGHGRIGGHYFHVWCPSVRKNKKALQRYRWCRENKICTMGENNLHLFIGWGLVGHLIFAKLVLISLGRALTCFRQRS